ncbi:peptidoglycan-binding protein LysM [Terasakiella brassicae]|uniref:Peptidoglycan-binding protein LysM n=1 Tax=Terasakiella brassicae TaxID=1634917 RepID=A0A917BVK2_9PROT|nr:LysM peptidoglycan-binding domain-containing protein [Terasakiella brassicae]GGF60031.1 peptidoglycan-binding protein LysM [Terasakiella brassicae]
MRSIVLIGLGLAVVALAIFLTLFNDEEPIAPQPQAETQQSQQSANTPSKPAKQPQKTENTAPSFDVVRINPDGDVVMAGRSTPKAEVTVLDGENELGMAKSDDRGEWVYLPTNPLETGERQLSLSALNPDGTIQTSEDVVVLVVPERKGDQTLAVSMSKDGSGPVTALQVPGAESLTLSIDAVNYDDKGELSISGTAPEGGAVFLYLDNEFLGNTAADDKGHWVVAPSRVVEPGVYQLRADHVDENRKVLNRVTIPFSRAPNMSNVPQDRQIVVQPGNSLWRIARRIYGTGFDYAVIYRANKEHISDPNLIYPGQVFEIPAQ